MLKTSTRSSSARAPTGPRVSTLCEKSEDTPHKNSVLYHLRTKFELETLEQVGNAFLQKDVFGVLLQQVEV